MHFAICSSTYVEHYVIVETCPQNLWIKSVANIQGKFYFNETYNAKIAESNTKKCFWLDHHKTLTKHGPDFGSKLDILYRLHFY